MHILGSCLTWRTDDVSLVRYQIAFANAAAIALQVTPQAECDSSVEKLISQHAARADSTEPH